MTFDEYSATSHGFAIYTGKSDDQLHTGLFYPCLGLAGEVGEVIEPIKKWYRKGCVESLNKEHLLLELGDVLWYTNEIAARLGFTLEQVAEANVEKLSKRRAEDKVVG